MSEKSNATAASLPRQYPKILLNIVLALAGLTAILHLYIGIVVYGIPLGIPLILIALVYLGGIGFISANNRRDLWLKIAIYWVLIVIVLWPASAAVNPPNTNIAAPSVHKPVEFILL